MIWPRDTTYPWSSVSKVNAGVSGQTFVYPLKTAFYLCEYVTISKIVDIILEPID